MFIISETCKVMKITLRFLFFFGTSNCISVLKRDPRCTPMGPLRAVTQLRLSAPKMLIQPLKFCTSVAKCRLLLFSLFTLSSPLSQPPPAPNFPWLACLAYALGWTVMKTHYGAWAETRVIHFTYSPGTPDPEWFPVFPIVLLMSLPQFSTFRLQYSNLGC